MKKDNFRSPDFYSTDTLFNEEQLLVRDAVREWVKENVSECDGTVNEIMVIREEFLSNKFIGYAEVSIKGKKYYPDVVVYADHKGQVFYTMPRNPCSLSVVEDLGESLSNMFN